jgi:hypothetical protein
LLSRALKGLGFEVTILSASWIGQNSPVEEAPRAIEQASFEESYWTRICGAHLRAT